jgi:pimeloyl-ACP methyl ester carboxylesterase
MPARQTIHKVRNIKARLFTAGEGPPLVFLHGAGGIERWLPIFDLLAARHSVMVPEHPCFGGSDNPPEIRNVADLAMYYLDFLDGLAAEKSGGGKVHLVGNSLGGWIAAELATRNCSQLATLSLLAPAGVRVRGVPMGDNFMWGPEEASRNLFHDQAFAERAIAMVPTEEEADRALVNRYAAARFGWEPRWFNPALARWLHRIGVPTLLLWGADDKLLPARYAEVWREQVPGIDVEIIPAYGQLLQIEKAELVASRILAFTDGR